MGRAAVKPRALALLGVAALVLAAAGAEALLRARSAESATAPLDEFGFRGPSFAVERDPRSWRVVVVGDESAFQAHLHEEQTWARRLAELFARDGTGTRVEVINASLRDGRAARVRELVEQRVASLHPSWLVVSLGVGEARAPFEPAREERWYDSSALARAAAELFGAERDAPVAIEARRWREVQRETAFEFGVQLAQLVEFARSRQIRLAFVRPPGAGRAPTVNETGLVEPRAGVARLHAELLDEVDRVAEEYRIPRIDAAGLATLPSEAFEDFGRLDALTSAKLAELVYTELRPRLR